MDHTPLLPTLVDRSRIQAYRSCGRYRWLRYHAGAERLGWAAKGPDPLPLAFGTFIHHAVERAWSGGVPSYGGDDLLPLQESILAETGGSLVGLADYTEIAHQVLQEWATTRLPLLRSSYELLVAEPPRQTVTLAPGIELMVRPDALVQDLLTGSLYYLEFKTSSTVGATWQAGWERNMQFLCMSWAIGELLGRRVEGVIVEGLQRGKWDSRRGMVSHPYISGRGGRIRAPLQGIKVGEDAGWESVLAALPPPIAAACSSTAPIVPPRAAISRWHEAAAAQETRLAAATAELHETPPSSREYRSILNRHFPCNEDQCASFYGRRCEFDSVCWQGASPEQLFQIRQPHHVGETTLNGQALREDTSRPSIDAADGSTPDRGCSSLPHNPSEAPGEGPDVAAGGGAAEGDDGRRA